jgi:uncharacterized protein (DUF2141 family)
LTIRYYRLLLAVFCAIAICRLAVHAFADNLSQNVLHVHVVGLRNSKGYEVCTLYNSSAASGFPGDDSKSLRTVRVHIESDSATCDFAGIPAGEYAIVTFHDENANGKFDRNMLGLPLEQYGFSNSLRPMVSAPKFQDAAVQFGGGEQGVTIRLAN